MSAPLSPTACVPLLVAELSRFGLRARRVTIVAATLAAVTRRIGCGMAALLLAGPAAAQGPAQPSPGADVRASADALARAAQNPIAAMISVPFQNNLNFNTGPLAGTQNILNIQPVIPLSLNADWNLIARSVIPVISQPAMTTGGDSTFGVGAVQVSAFLSPAQPGRLIWGVGAIMQVPTATDQALGSNVWGGGPTGVALMMQGPWVFGGLVNNVWSFGGDDPGRRYNTLTIQPFVNYNFPQRPGRYLSFSPLITANWEARGGEQWTVPLGLALGQVFRIGGQAMNAQAGAYYNVVRPDAGPEWQLRAQLSLMFPR
jgi:hypothetical protein